MHRALRVSEHVELAVTRQSRVAADRAIAASNLYDLVSVTTDTGRKVPLSEWVAAGHATAFAEYASQQKPLFAG